MIDGKPLNSIPEYSVYYNIKTRCYNSNRRGWHNYGGRGIKVCDRWLESFHNFYEDMGSRPSPKHSIDRVDPNGNYEPDNCRWATSKEQMETKRIPLQLICTNCGCEDRGKMRRGLCHACNEYERRNSVSRPTTKRGIRDLYLEKKAKKRKPVLRVCIKTGDILERFDLVTGAVKEYGMGVVNVLSGRTHTCKGFKWKYEKRNV